MKTLLKIILIIIFTHPITVMASDLKVGDTAPNFTLESTDGDFYQLSDYLGKQTVVLAWYPMANTHGCTLECRSLVQKGH